MTVEIEMTVAEYNSISEYAAENKIGIAELFLKTMLEKIGHETINDEDLLKISNKIMKERSEVYKVLAQ